jgi:hypothetical protein
VHRPEEKNQRNKSRGPLSSLIDYVMWHPLHLVSLTVRSLLIRSRNQNDTSTSKRIDAEDQESIGGKQKEQKCSITQDRTEHGRNLLDEGSNRNRTNISGIRIRRADHYTIEPLIVL